jgi:hypothetical protein
MRKEAVMKAIVAILSVALVAVSGGAIHLWRQLEASRHQVADLKAQAESMAASARSAAVPAPAATVARAEPVAAPAATSAAVQPAPPAVSKAVQDSVAVMRATIASPENIARSKLTFKAQLPSQYPDVGKVLGLSAEEVDRLYELLAEQNANRQRAMGMPSSDGGTSAFSRTVQGEKDELQSLLGSKYAKWQEYNTELPTRRQVRDLTAVLSSAGAPLSDAQGDSLIPVLAAVEKRNTQERMTQPGPPSLAAAMSRYTPEANQKLLDAAAPHLTPQQLESYRQMLERESSRESSTRNMMLDAEKRVEAARQGQR